MENTYIKREKFATLGLAALDRFAFLPNIFRMRDASMFANAKNDTVTWTTRRVTDAREYEFRTRTAPIVYDTIGQTSVSITLDKHIYSAVPITDEERFFDVESSAEDYLIPQIEAVVKMAEEKVMLGLREASFKAAPPDYSTTDDPYLWGLDVRRILNEQGTPAGGRVVLVGTEVEQWLLTSERLAPVTATPESSRVVREATLGKMAGLTFLTCPMLKLKEYYAVTPDTLMLANAAPLVTSGMTGFRLNNGKWSLRHVSSYVNDWLQEGSIFSTFMGVSSVNDELETEKDLNGFIRYVRDEDGNPIATGKNVRGMKGEITVPAGP